MIDSPVLVLNQNYQPLNVCNVMKAFVLFTLGKAEVMERGRGYLHSATRSFQVPSVIRFIHDGQAPIGAEAAISTGSLLS